MNMRLALLCCLLLLLLLVPTGDSTSVSPDRIVNSIECPVNFDPNIGQYVIQIVFNTTSRCSCVPIPPTNSSRARWFDNSGVQVGVDDSITGGSLLTLSANNSVFEQEYECRYEDPATKSVSSLYLKPVSQESPLVVIEKGYNSTTTLTCPVPSPYRQAVWSELKEQNSSVLTTCQLNNGCQDKFPNQFQGSILTNNNLTYVNLNIQETPKRDTQFVCELDNTTMVVSAAVYVYAWPNIPTCTTTQMSEYVVITCSTVNVYPYLSASLHRREKNLTEVEMDVNNTDCVYGVLGQGSQGDLSAKCHWFLWKNRLLSKNTFFVEMSTQVYGVTIRNRKPATSADFVFVPPEVSIVNSIECPVSYDPNIGQWVIQIVFNTTSRCSCVPSPATNSSRARWFDNSGVQVGVDDSTTRGSLLTLPANNSVFEQEFECRSEDSATKSVASVYLKPVSLESPLVVIEKGYNSTTTLVCPVPSPYSRTVWSKLIERDSFELTTCQLNNGCQDKFPNQFRGSLLTSNNLTSVNLNIQETPNRDIQFVCELDNTTMVVSAAVYVYAWPLTPTCTTETVNQYVMVSCSTANLYPYLSASLVRREKTLTEVEMDVNKTDCVYGVLGQGSQGDLSAQCHWFLWKNRLLSKNTFFVEMSTQVYGVTIRNRKPATSADFTVAGPSNASPRVVSEIKLLLALTGLTSTYLLTKRTT